MDKDYYETAEKLLSEEFALALQTTPDAMREQLHTAAHWYGRLPAPAGHAAAGRRSQTNPPPRVAAFTIHTKAYQPRIQARRLRAGLFISAQIARNARLCYNTFIYEN